MADEGTLATTAEVLLAIGQNASTAQKLEANTNIWVKWAEGDISVVMDNDIVANYGSVSTNFKRYLARIASLRAAWYAILQDQNNWSLATSQSKLNICNASWKAFLSDMKDNKSDTIATLGL